MRILHLIEALDDGDAARALQALAPGLTEHAALEVCCLGPDTPAAEGLRRAGIVVHALGWTRWFDPGVFWNLRDVLREAAPDAIHVWDLRGLRALALAGHDLLARVVMSPAADDLAWWDRCLLERVGRLSQGNECVIAPAPAAEKKSPDTFFRIACAEGHRQAVWAFDFLLLIYPDAQLHLLGAAPRSEQLHGLTQGLGNSANVHVHYAHADVAAVLSAADVVWIAGVTNRGRRMALEAMAQGKATIAAALPCVRDLIHEGDTGFLTPPGDVIALARRTHTLLQDDDLRRRLGHAARTHIERHFPLADAIAHWRELYRSIAA